MDAVAVIAAGVKRKVLQHRAEPDGTGSQTLDVGKFLLDAREFSALILGVIRVIVRLMDRWSCGIVEPIHHEKIDHLVAPIRGRWKWPTRLTSGRLRLIQHCLDFRRKRDVNIMAFF